MADIFISYSRADKTRVAPIVAALEAEGWTVWWDPEISPGQEFDQLITRELEAARALVVVWSPNSVDSRWVRGEARDAADREVLVPVRLDNAKLPIDFRAIHTTDLDHWNEDAQNTAFRSLCKSLETKLGAPVKQARTMPAEQKHRVAICVLPFSNMSGDPEQEYFSDGITEDIITDLGKVSALSIVSRNTAFSFKSESIAVADVARQTGATHVLVGSVRKAGARVRITAQIIDAANDSQVWGERYDRDLNDIFALQDEISKAIVAALKLTLLPEEKKALEHRSTTNAEAYKLYLMARQFWLHDNERNSNIVIRICKHIVAIDPDYAEAWAMMALARWNLFLASSLDEHELEFAANRALELAPRLADAHAAVAGVHRRKGAFDKAYDSCLNAIRLDPESYVANRLAGLCCIALRKFDEAIAYFGKAAEMDESDVTAASFIPQCFEALGQIEQMKSSSRKALLRIERIIAGEPAHSRALGLGVAMLATLGETERAREWALRARLVDPDNISLLYNLACAMSLLKDADAAFELLDFVGNAADHGMIGHIEADSDLDFIRNDPRLSAIVGAAKARLSASA